MSRKWGGVLREQDIEGALQLSTLIDGSSARRYAVQEEAYLAALETGVAGINHQAAVCAVRGDCRGGFGLVAVANSGHQYRVGRSFRNSTYEHQSGCEHHGFSDLGSRRRRWSWWNCRSRRSVRWNGRRGGRRGGQRRKCQVEAGLYLWNSMGLIGVRLIRLHVAEKEGDRAAREGGVCRHGQVLVPSLCYGGWL